MTVSVFSNDEEYVTGVSYAGQDLPDSDKFTYESEDSKQRVEIWYLLDPTTVAVSGDVVVEFSKDLDKGAVDPEDGRMARLEVDVRGLLLDCGSADLPQVLCAGGGRRQPSAASVVTTGMASP